MHTLDEAISIMMKVCLTYMLIVDGISLLEEPQKILKSIGPQSSHHQLHAKC